MPPKTPKRGSAGSGSKRGGRLSRGTAKSAQNQQQQQSELVEEKTVIEEEIKVEENLVVEEKPVVEEDNPVVEDKAIDMNQIAPEAVEDANSAKKDEEEVKESIDEYERDERLDLEDNDPEYEPEEYGGVDYDEKEIEQEEGHEVGDEVEEEPEENVVEEGDSGEEEVEDGHDEIEGEEDDEHADEEHDRERAEMADVDEEEHREVVKERRKRKEFEVFVGGLDKDATEDDLRKVFSEVGVVTEVRLMMNPQTKKNKGFAFLRFENVEQAKRAVAELKNPVINGKQCGVTPSQDSDTLYLGNICKTWTKEALKEKLKHYGVTNVEDITLVEDSNDKGTNRGFAFLEFSSRSDAMDAFKRLQKRDVTFGVDKPAKVSFADSFIDPGDEIMSQVKTVFIDALPPSWDEDYVRNLLKKYGEVEKIELARNMPAARRKDYGFVTFGSHDAAIRCADSITGTELGEGDKKAKVRARLSRPLQRGRGKHVGRGDYRPSRGSAIMSRPSWSSRPAPRSFSSRGVRGIGSRAPPIRSISARDRRPVMSIPVRSRPLPPPARSYDRRPADAAYSKSSVKRDYGRRDDLPPPRSRVAVDYGSRMTSERRPTYRDYPPRGSDYSDPPRSTARAAPRRGYVDDGYSQRYERPPPPPPPSHPSYREGRPRDYDSLSGSKRSYAAVDDVPPRYADTGARQSRARLEYDYGGSASQYGDAYGDRVGRSSLGYGSGSRSSISGQDSHGVYSSRQGMSYGGGSYGGSDVGGMYSSSYGGDYVSRGNDVGGSSYSSMYSGRGAGGGSSYMGSGGSGSYY
ncbi:putative nucleotide-binding alpha-beta plait domain-containing protein [Medicago truncatula]|uniref:Heterogeneous nuclear ribonucleoprotein n=1 Tax=Medicago truncatula TaxID=3880 RepID=A0A072TM71_MEDTR|nr:RNA-binding motif protein, Y chromosome, family 1 member B isoform X1 [Medicago truncatula]XP_024629607.1 RNA-binding motif protein, Y chromosome, family 1 member B isoform X1 [Medicago truncatula]XP_024629608.1 RNA-binding motif protein, Y chromosome, family 1 member B isoform X1 [Medicago truncatula]XP_039685338.1 RNA-binding motif protein, Y chromosome, family 1 member B isoform X1 [Medicago truncatula]KEH17923.1 heterogeneous nuclear ribonucleoprotein [Medicago truncatula]RHN38696.1 put